MSLELISNELKNEQDLETIARLGHLYFSDVYMTNYKSHRQWMHKEFKKPIFRKPRNGYVVAYDNETLLGFALHGRFDLEESDIYSKAAKMANLNAQGNTRSIKLIAVSPELQHDGIGTKMAEKVIGDSYKLGAKQLFALCWMGNGGKSYRMFTKLGFERIMYYPRAYANGDSGIVVAKELL